MAGGRHVASRVPGARTSAQVAGSPIARELQVSACGHGVCEHGPGHRQSWPPLQGTALSRAAPQDPKVGSRARGLRTGDTLHPAWAHGRLRGLRRPPNTAPPPWPGHGWAPRHRRLPSHEERGVPGRKDVREPHFPARLPAPGPLVSPAPGPGPLPPQTAQQEWAVFTPALGGLGPAGLPLRHWHGRMFRKGECTSRPKWLPHLKPNPSRGPPREPGSPHAHPQAALPLASCHKMPYTFTALHVHPGRRGTHKHVKLK